MLFPLLNVFLQRLFPFIASILSVFFHVLSGLLRNFVTLSLFAFLVQVLPQLHFIDAFSGVVPPEGQKCSSLIASDFIIIACWPLPVVLSFILNVRAFRWNAAIHDLLPLFATLINSHFQTVLKPPFSVFTALFSHGVIAKAHLQRIIFLFLDFAFSFCVRHSLTPELQALIKQFQLALIFLLVALLFTAKRRFPIIGFPDAVLILLLSCHVLRNQISENLLFDVIRLHLQFQRLSLKVVFPIFRFALSSDAPFSPFLQSPSSGYLFEILARSTGKLIDLKRIFIYFQKTRAVIVAVRINFNRLNFKMKKS